MESPPDVLVLGAGGVLGEAWMMGVLAGIEDHAGFDLRRCEHFVGTSAGAIVSSQLAAGNRPRRPQEIGSGPEPPSAPAASGLSAAALEAMRSAGAWALATSSTFAPLALGIAAPGGALVRAALLRQVPRPAQNLEGLRLRMERAGTKFDGRLRIAAVDRETGRRVVFGAPGAPAATVAEAVVASCTVPWLFAPVKIGDREYVDGGVWSPTNLDAAPSGRDTHVLCLNPTASIVGRHGMVDVVRNFIRTTVSVEALALRRRGAVVETVAPSTEAAALMGVNFMDPEPRAHVLAAGYRQGLRLAAER
ncbi:MAG: patatin-like phospholipase family protein [Solirubrobacterales bacterium]|nr:patatin-like phospholipase family protein [Solirubrobacterales bacterium]